MSSTFIPYAKIVSSLDYCHGLSSAEGLLDSSKYEDLPISCGAGTIKECHYLELRRGFMGLGYYNITHYVVVLEGNNKMVRLPEKNIREIGGGEEVATYGKEALDALKEWRRGLKTCFGLSRHEITYLLPHPEFVRLGKLSVCHEHPKGTTAYPCEGCGE